MPDKKKKINTNHYNELERFVIDMPFNDAVITLDASEKDMPQLRSTILETDDEAKLIRLTYAEASALLILVKTWARGSMAQVTIFRGEIKHPIIPEVSKLSCGTMIILFLSSYGLLTALQINPLISLATIPIMLFIDWFVNFRINKKYRVEDITRIQDKPLQVNETYEKILLNYVKNKLGEEIEAPEDDQYSVATRKAIKKITGKSRD